MSFEVTGYVEQHSEATGATRVVLMVIAGWADSRGIAVRFPQGRIARYANLTARHVRRAIDWLMDHGELVVEIGMGGSEDVAGTNDRTGTRF